VDLVEQDEVALHDSMLPRDRKVAKRQIGERRRQYG